MQVGVQVKFNNVSKQIIPPKKFEVMLSQITEEFKEVLQGPFHISYFDKDNDLISVTCQEDYDIALNESEGKNFSFEISLDEGGITKKEEVKQAFSIPETSNVESGYVPQGKIAPIENPSVPTKTNTITPIEEEKKISGPIASVAKDTPKEEKSIEKSPKIQDKQTTVPIRENENSTPKEEEKEKLKKSENITPKAPEKVIPKKSEPEKVTPKEEKIHPVQLDPAISQSIAAAIHPKVEEEIPINEDEACLVCLGTKKNEKGKKCKECKGTGRMNLALLSRIQKMVEKHVNIEMEKQSQVLEQSKKIENLLESLSQSSIIKKEVPCSLCRKGIKLGNVAYHCILCPNLFLCEECEDEKGHQHNLIKGRCGYGPMDPKERNRLEMKMEGQSTIEEIVPPGTVFTKTWTLINTGRKPWPKDAIINPLSGEDLKGKFTEIGEVLPNKTCDVVGYFVAPNRSGNFKQIYQLVAFGKNFGPQIEVEVYVKNEDNIPEEYKENIRIIQDLNLNVDPKRILELLQKHNNDRDEAINELLA